MNGILKFFFHLQISLLTALFILLHSFINFGHWFCNKSMLEASAAEDIVYSSLFTGVHGNYLKPSIKNAGLDPDNLPDADKSSMNFGSGGNTDSKAWKDIWGSGQGIGNIKDSPSVAELVGRIESEYKSAFEDFKAKISG